VYLLRIAKNWSAIDSPEADANWLAYDYEVDEIQRADGFLLVYNVAARSSFDHIQRYHLGIQRLRTPGPENPSVDSGSTLKIPVILVGNQCDRDREVSAYEGHALAQKLGCAFLETSAKTGTNVEKVFLELARMSKLQKHESSSAPPAALHRSTCERRFPTRDHRIRPRVRGGECSIS
jgi:GTPase KRas protein